MAHFVSFHSHCQYASKMGYRVFAFSRGRAKEELARKLGAHEYFDTTEEGFVEKVKVSEEDSISSTFSFSSLLRPPPIFLLFLLLLFLVRWHVISWKRMAL